jgi:glycerol-3-phosphate O-acyltransferase
VAQVSLFYLLEGRKDRTSRIIYTVSGLLAVTAAGLLLLLSL